MRFPALLLAVFSLIPLLASAETRVVASIPALGSIAREVVGTHGEVTVLAPPNQDPHFVDGKPALILSLHRADLLIHAGAGLEAGWLPTLMTGARNGKIQEGRPGNLDASALAGPLLDVPARLDRSLGDVHPGGNPHTWYDPRRAKRIAGGIAERLGQLDPENAAAYERNATLFARRLDEKAAEWEERMKPHRGRAFVPYHKSLSYLADWLGLREIATIEPLPGIAPSPSHLASLIVRMKETSPKPVVVSELWYNQRIVKTVAEKAEAPLVTLPGDVGSTRENGDYLSFMEDVVTRLQAALEAK